ncbi:uncharacterized protein LOC109727444 [Ananas comosus]|uniref:Uncharacterized protein LOC109727444 n=1 Tax=Ananas comosus TaxID=4615 RepID=A0A199URY4_ANACO|nr:uncharacterized protein LOC109727444 [Ananas comosus]OAY67558.1 hypothetical protein ACMD2_27438 [Ananas comosus]
MKRYKRRKQFNIIPTLLKYLVGVLLLGLFLSSPLWLPKLSSSLNLFVVVVLPNVAASLFGPKCLFVVCNLIVVFLVSESRLSGTYSMPDMYEEFVRRTAVGSRTSSNSTTVADKRGSAFMQIGLVGGVEEGEGKGGGEVEGVEGGCCWEMEEEDDEDLVHEWNRRFEDFIARVRKQRRLEAKRMPLCYCYG